MAWRVLHHLVRNNVSQTACQWTTMRTCRSFPGVRLMQISMSTRRERSCTVTVIERRWQGKRRVHKAVGEGTHSRVPVVYSAEHARSYYTVRQFGGVIRRRSRYWGDFERIDSMPPRRCQLGRFGRARDPHGVGRESRSGTKGETWTEVGKCVVRR